MADDLHYIPGSFYRICDITGFKVRAENTKKQWNGYIVRKESWEARHPQDLVRGVADYQAVPETRPRPATKYTKIPVVLTTVNGNYGPPLYRASSDPGDPAGRGYIYRGDGLGANETEVVTPDSYPRSW